MKVDGCDVIGYTAWSLMDNFEWEAGYDEKFGMHAVDMNDPERKRVAKASARYFAQVISDNGFPEPKSGAGRASPLTLTAVFVSLACTMGLRLSRGV